MKCPIDGAELAMTDRQGIEIDYCPKCRGVWLDRGELDKIIERAGDDKPVPQFVEKPRYPQPEHQYRPEGQHYGSHGHHHKKKKSMLSEIFDF